MVASSLSACATDAAKCTLVGYDGVDVQITHFNELKCILTTAPNHHIVGYIVLCIPLWQN
jgi:hypothetical protein